MKRPDPCLPTGAPPTPEQLAEIERQRITMYRGYEVHLCLDGSAWFRKPGEKAMNAAKSVAHAKQRIDARLPKRKPQAAQDPYENWTYRLGRDRDQIGVSRKIVEGRDVK